jgi:hypothetical protein
MANLIAVLQARLPRLSIAILVWYRDASSNKASGMPLIPKEVSLIEVLTACASQLCISHKD